MYLGSGGRNLSREYPHQGKKLAWNCSKLYKIRKSMDEWNETTTMLASSLPHPQRHLEITNYRLAVYIFTIRSPLEDLLSILPNYTMKQFIQLAQRITHAHTFPLVLGGFFLGTVYHKETGYLLARSRLGGEMRQSKSRRFHSHASHKKDSRGKKGTTSTTNRLSYNRNRWKKRNQIGILISFPICQWLQHRQRQRFPP